MVLGCDYNASGVTKQLHIMGNRLLAIGVAGLVVMMILLSLIIRSIMRGLRKINDKISEIVNDEGDLTQRLNVKTGD